MQQIQSPQLSNLQKFARSGLPPHSNLTIIVLSLIIFLQAFCGQVKAINQCSNPNATVYDRFLEPFMYFANFNRSANPFLKFKNPFEGITELSNASVTLWARFPITSNPQVNLRGRILECSNQMKVQLDMFTLSVNATTYMTNSRGALITPFTPIENQLNTNLFRSSAYALSQWNNYAISVVSRKLRIHLNGLFVSESNLNSTNLVVEGADSCMIGNSIDLTQPLSLQLRHLVFSNYGFSSNNIIRRVRANLLPNDSSVLAYFKFHKDYNQQEIYFYNTSLGLSQVGLTIQMSSEPEQVCYCTKPSPAFLRVANNFKLRQLDFSPFPTFFDQNGATFTFQIFAQQLNSSNDQVIMGINGYADIVLANTGTRLRVDLYNTASTIQQSVVLDQYQFRFNFWTTYTISILSNQVVLIIDGETIQTLPHQVSLPRRSPAKLNIALNPTSYGLVFLIQTVQIIQETTSRPTVFNRTFTQNLLLPTFQSQNVSSGRLQFESNSQLCSATEGLFDPASFIPASGSGPCISNRWSVNFTNSSNSYGTSGSTTLFNTGLSMGMMSARSNLTIEIWVRDKSIIRQTNQNVQQVIFENSNDNRAILTQVSILPGANPDVLRRFNVQPQTTQASQRNVAILASNTIDRWIHLAMISNSSSITLYLYNTFDGSLLQNTTQGIAFSQVTANRGFVNTSLGSSITGANKFVGMLRELRIFSQIRTDKQISISRFSSAYQSIGYIVDGSQILLHAFRLDDGFDYQNLFDSVLTNPTNLTASMLDDKNPALSSFVWATDEDLVICSDGYYYDGLCCRAFDYSALNTSVVDFTFSYSSTRAAIKVVLIPGVLMNASLLAQMGYQADFKIISVGNDFDPAQTSNILNVLFNQNNSQGFDINSTLVDPLYFSITLQATIYSSLQIANTLVLTRTLQLQCPRFALDVNNMNSGTDDPYILSNRTNHLVRITARQNSTLCFNNFTKTAQVINMNRVSWSHNFTSRYTFAQVFNTSGDTYSITQRYEISGLPRLAISAVITFNASQTVIYSIILDYQNFNVENGYPSPFALSNQLVSIPTSFNFNSAYMEPNPNQIYSVGYRVNCPAEIFRTQQQYDKLCVFSGSQFYLDISNTSDFNLRLSKTYSYEFIVFVQGTYIMKGVQINVTYYMDGSNQATCPSIIYRSDYVFDKVNNDSFELNPVAYLFCSGLFYQFRSVAWVVTDFASKKTLTNVLNFTSENPLSVYLRSDNRNVQSIVSGSQILLNGTFTTLVANSTSFTGATRTISNQQALVTFKIVQFVPQIVATTFRRTAVEQGQIDFLQPNITLNASTSYDPDNSSAVLWYSWTCPPQVFNCSFNTFGQRNNSFIIDFWFRFRNGLKYMQNYTFTVTTWSRDNSLKPQQSLSYNISFLPPQNTDVNYAMLNTTCEQLDVDNSQYILRDSQNQRVIWLSRSNYTNVFFNIISRIDNGNLTQRSPCGFGNVTNLQLLAYFGPNVLADDASPFVIYNNTNVSATENRTQQFQFSLAAYQALQNIRSGQVYNLTLYQFVQRSGSNRTFINTLSITLLKSKSPLEIVISSTLLLDVYQDLVIDASKIQDSNTQAAISNAIFTWTCPNTSLACSRVTGSKLQLSYKERQDALINSVDQLAGYLFTVFATDRTGRTSDIYFVRVYLTKQRDYGSCFSLTINGTMDLAKFASGNNTIYVEQNQYTNTTIQVIPQVTCTNANLTNPSWQSAQALDSNQNYFITYQGSNSGLQLLAAKMKYLTPWRQYSLIYRQNITMGQDADLYTKSVYVNLVVNPSDLIAKISGKALVIDGIDSAITLSGANSVDPMGLSYDCYWICPSTLNLPQSLCSQAQANQNCQINLQILDIKTSQADFLRYGALTDQLHNFELTIVSKDQVRVAKAIQPVYLSAGLDPILQNSTNFTQCQIVITSNQGEFIVDRVNRFEMECQKSTDYKLLLNQGLAWQVQNLLAETDYYTLNNALILNPYTVSKLSDHLLNVTVQSMKQIKQSSSSSTGNSSQPSLRALQQENNSTDDQQNQNQEQQPQQNDSSQQESYDYDTLASISFKLGYSKVIQTARSGILEMGSIKVDSNDEAGASSIYISNYSMAFTGFQFSKNYSIYLQLRAYSTVHNDQVILLPLKTFDSRTLSSFYSEVFLSQFSYLAIDFYDSALNYINSYDLTNQDIFSQATIGSQQYTEFDKRLFPIVQKSFNDYPQTVEGRIQIEKDFYQVAILVEMLRGGKVTGASTAIKNSYAQKIIQFLRFSLSNLLDYYDVTVSVDYADARYNLEKTVIVIIYDLILAGSNIEQSFQSVLSVMTVAMQDYDSLIDYSEDPELIRSMVLYIQNLLNVQLIRSTLSAKQTFFNQIASINTKIAQNDVVQALNSPQQVVSIQTQSQSRTVYKILANQVSPIEITNSLNSREYVRFSDPSILRNLNVSQLLVQYGIDSNTSSAVRSTLEIQAFSSNQSIVPINFTNQNASIIPYFEFRMQINDTQRQLIQNRTQDTTTRETFNFTCVYIDTQSTASSTSSAYAVHSQGLNTSYESNSTDVTCMTTHLTPFTIIFSRAEKATTDNGGGGVIVNPNNTNNSTNESSNSNNTSSGQFYNDNTGAYAASIAVTAVITFGTILLAMCHKYKPTSEKYQLEKRAKYPFSKVLTTIFRTHHPLLNCFTTMRNPNLAIPKYLNFLTLWIYMFGITFWTVVIFVTEQSSNVPKGQLMLIVAAVLLVSITIIRPIYGHVIYTLYHGGGHDPLQLFDSASSEQSARIPSGTLSNLRASQSYNQSMAANNNSDYNNRDVSLNNRSNNQSRSNLKASGGLKSTEVTMQQRNRQQQYQMNKDFNRASQGPSTNSRLNNPHSKQGNISDLYMNDFDQFEGGSREDEDKSAIYDERDIELSSSDDDQNQPNSYPHPNPQSNQAGESNQTQTTNNLSLYINEIQEESKEEYNSGEKQTHQGNFSLPQTNRNAPNSFANNVNSNFKGSTIGKQHQDALNIQIEEEDSDSDLNSPQLTEHMQDSPQAKSIRVTNVDDKSFTQVNNLNLQSLQRQQQQNSPLNLRTNSNRSNDYIQYSAGRVADERGDNIRLESTKKAIAYNNHFGDDTQLDADQYGPPAGSANKMKESQFKQSRFKGPEDQSSFRVKEDFVVEHKREISEVYAEEIDRLPAEPEPEFIPNDPKEIITAQRYSRERPLEVRDFQIDVNDTNKKSCNTTRCLLVSLLILLLIGEMAITYALSRQIEGSDNLKQWIGSVIIIALVFLFIIDSLRLLIFAFVYACKQPNYKEAKCSAYFLLGNFSLICLQQLQLEIQL